MALLLDSGHTLSLRRVSEIRFVAVRNAKPIGALSLLQTINSKETIRPTNSTARRAGGWDN